MLLEFLKRLRRRSASQSLNALAVTSHDAFVPLTEPAELLTRSRKRLTALRLESGYNETQFKTYLYGPLLQCACYVHELPASRAENHRVNGGLFHFAFETAFLAFRRADGKLFTGPLGAGVSSRDTDIAWRYAAFIAGLCVPLGSAATGVIVRSANEKHTWNPYAGSLFQWARDRQVNDYVIEWRSRQDARNPAPASTWIAARLLETHVLDKLFLGDGAILEAVLDAVRGRSGSMLSELVIESMNAVIDQDLALSRNTDNLPTTGIPVEHRLLDAIRGLIRDKWTSNAAGSRVWVTAHGVFINWKPAVNDITVRLRADGVAGLPRDPDTIAELLAGKSILAENPHSKTLAHYFRIVVQAANVPKHPMDCVRVVNPALLGLKLDTLSPVAIDIAGWPNASKDGEVSIQEELNLEPGMPDHRPADPEKTVEQAAHKPACHEAVPEINDQQEIGPAEKVERPSSSALSRYGEAGRVLEALSNQSESPFWRVQEGIALAYPSAIAPFSDRPKEFLASCQAQSLLVPEGGNPQRVLRGQHKTGKGQSEKYIVFVPRLAKSLGVPNRKARRDHEEITS